MRSHAKASSAGSTQRRVIGPDRVIVALSTLVLFLVLASSASAVTTRLPLGFSPIDGSGTGVTLHFPSGVAVDETSGNVFLDDGASGNVVDVFGAEGGVPSGVASPYQITGFFFSEEPSGAAVDNSATSPNKGMLYVVDVVHSQVKKFVRNGGTEEYEAAGELIPSEGPGFGEPMGAAVDSEGNVFVADWGSRSVVEFSPTGTQLARIDVSGTVRRPSSVALDSAGDLFVQSYNKGNVYKYPANGSGEIEPAVSTQVVASNATGVAVDIAANKLFVGLGNSVVQYDATTLTKQLEFGTGILGRSQRIAVNSASNRVYVSDSSKANVAVFGAEVKIPGVSTEDADGVTANAATLHGTVNADGEQLTDCHFEYVTQAAFESTGFSDLSSGGGPPCVPAAASIPPDSSNHAVSAEVSGLTSGTTYHFRLVATSAEGTASAPDRVLTTAIGPPAISAQSVEAVSFSDATLSATINPQGAATTYHIEYGPTASYGQSTSESLPIGFGGDDSDHTVSVHIGGLATGAEYHFRFVAKSSAGAVEGPDTSFKTYPPPPTFGPCANEALRNGAGARLPDCRAYEQATPVDKHGANAQGTENLIEASRAGDRVIFFTNGGLPTTGGSSSLYPFIASRGPAGWSSDGLQPATDPGFDVGIVGWSDDLSITLTEAPGPGNVGRALYLRDSNTATFQLTPAASESFGATSLAATAADTSHLIFESEAALLPSAPAGANNLYELDHGALTLAGRIPAGSATSCDDASGPACIPAPEGASAGPGPQTAGIFNYTQNTISRDGSRIFFTAGDKLYVREGGAKTTQVSASQAAVPDPNGPKPATFTAATPDGSKVFFTSCEKLTDDSAAVSTSDEECDPSNGQQGQDLYSYDTSTGELTDLTVGVNAGDPLGPNVKGVLGISDDGSYVYFVAGSNKLYVYHEGTIAFIASLAAADFGDWLNYRTTFGTPQKTARVATDGSAVLFSSYQKLTSYDNTEATANSCGLGGESGEPCAEFYRYSAADEELICVSCNPTGARPGGNAVFGRNSFFFANAIRSSFLTRNLSADGNRAFFESRDPLLPTDINGVTDVYEWEAQGSGSCQSAGGCIYLISSGTSQNPAQFADASANGDHVFFFSEQQLVPGDRDQLADVYDASVGGGLPSQHPLAPSTCTSTACQANPAPPPEQTPASASFSGPGDAHEGSTARKCPKGKRKVRRAGKVRCLKAGKSKQRKRHDNRGGAK